MEAIRNYLETMFLHLPNTPEVYRAKNELWQMMEDKYAELKEAGKSENEAVGTVIAEFGNLAELAEDLGIRSAVADLDLEDSRSLSISEVKQYLSDYAKHSFWIAFGVMLCILSVCAPILSEAILDLSPSGTSEVLADAAGPIFMFVFIAVAVGFFVYSGVRIGHWKYLKEERCVIDFSATEYIHGEQARFKNTYALLLTIGIMLCILSVVPAIAFDSITANTDFWEDLSGMMFFLFVAVGVFLIVLAAMRMGSYSHLLRLNGQDTVGSNYVKNKQEKTEYSSREAAAVMSVYWQTVTCFYLIISFLTFSWGKTWIIWPIAAIVHSLLKNLLQTPED